MHKEATTNIYVKQINRRRVFDLLLTDGNLTKLDIVNRLNLSLPTVTQNINDLLEMNLIQKSGYLPSSGGRKAVMLTCNEEAYYSIGLDITRKSIRIVIVNLLGKVVFSDNTVRAFSDDDNYFRFIGEFVCDVLQRQEIPAKHILGVGISVPAIVSADMQHIEYVTVIDYSNGCTDDFEKYLPFNCMFCNDSNAGGIAELWNNPSINDAVYISVSDSVGGAFLINHEIFDGDNLRCMEVGHMTIVPDGKQCYCGKFGCVDAYCRTGNLTTTPDETLDEFFIHLEEGDYEHTQIWQRYLNYLAITINNLHMLFDCNVIIGGYLGCHIDDYLDQLHQMVAERNTFIKSGKYLFSCQYKKSAAAVGAALIPLKAFYDSI